MKLNSWQRDVRKVITKAMEMNEEKLTGRTFYNTSDFVDNLLTSQNRSFDEENFMENFAEVFGGKDDKIVSSYILAHSDIWDTLSNAADTGFDYSMDLKENTKLFLFNSVMEESKNLMYRSSFGDLDTFKLDKDMAENFKKVFCQDDDDLAFDITVKSNFKKRAYHIYKEEFEKNNKDNKFRDYKAKPHSLKEFLNYEYRDRIFMEHLLSFNDFDTYKKVNPFTISAVSLSEEENKAVVKMANDFYEQRSFGRYFNDVNDYVSTVISFAYENGAKSVLNKTWLGKLKNFKMDADMRDDFRNTILHIEEEVRFMKLDSKDNFMRSCYRFGYLEKGKKLGYPAMNYESFKEMFFKEPIDTIKKQILKSFLSATKYYEYEKYNGIKHENYVLSFERNDGSKWELKAGEALRNWDLHMRGFERENCAKVLNYVVGHFRKMESLYDIKQNCPVTNAVNKEYLETFFNKYLISHEVVREQKIKDSSFDRTLNGKELASEVVKLVQNREKVKKDLGVGDIKR